jgi:hypothetical protein
MHFEEGLWQTIIRSKYLIKHIVGSQSLNASTLNTGMEKMARAKDSVREREQAKARRSENTRIQ